MSWRSMTKYSVILENLKILLVMNMIVVIVYVDVILGDSIHQCHNAYSCDLTSIIDNSTASSSNIECYGYFSCAQAITIQSTGSADIYCYGSYSCYQAELIQRTSTTYYKHIDCYVHGIYICLLICNVYCKHIK